MDDLSTQLSMQKQELLFWFKNEIKGKENTINTMNKEMMELNQKYGILEEESRELKNSSVQDKIQLEKIPDFIATISELKKESINSKELNDKKINDLEIGYKNEINKLNNENIDILNKLKDKHREEILILTDKNKKIIDDINITHSNTLAKLKLDTDLFDQQRQNTFQSRYDTLIKDHENEKNILLDQQRKKDTFYVTSKTQTSNVFNNLLKESEQIRQDFSSDDVAMTGLLSNMSAAREHIERITNAAMSSDNVDNNRLDALNMLNPNLQSLNRSKVEEAKRKIREVHNNGIKATEESINLKKTIDDLSSSVTKLQLDKDTLSKTILTDRNKHAEETKALDAQFQEEYEKFSARKDMELESKNLEIESNELEQKLKQYETNMRTFESEVYSLRNSNSSSVYSSEHYMRLASELQIQLKNKEETYWQTTVEMERVKSELQYLKTISNDAKRDNSLKDASLNQMRDLSHHVESELRARCSSLENSLLQSVGELQSKAKMCNDLQRRVEQLSDIVQDGIRKQQQEFVMQPPNNANNNSFNPNSIPNGINYNPYGMMGIAPPPNLKSIPITNAPEAQISSRREDIRNDKPIDNNKNIEKFKEKPNSYAQLKLDTNKKGVIKDAGKNIINNAKSPQMAKSESSKIPLPKNSNVVKKFAPERKDKR